MSLFPRVSLSLSRERPLKRLQSELKQFLAICNSLQMLEYEQQFVPDNNWECQPEKTQWLRAMYHLPKKKIKQQIKILEIGVEQLIVFYFTVNEEIVDNRELNEQWNGEKNRMRGKLMLRCTLIAAILSSVNIPSGPFNQIHSFLIVHWEQKLT